LEGIIAEENGHLDKSIELLNVAKALEDNMLYTEPKDWVLPVRQYLGNVLLRSGALSEAEKAFLDDLKQNPKNGWSLTGLATALLMQGRTNESTKAQRKAKEAFARTDVKITAAVF
jgi:cytochrome c-type biogenesis protein CcmH/NrfG